MGFTSAGLANGGQTSHYQISYDDTFSAADGVTRAAQLMDTCEQDFDLMQSWFAGVNFQFSFPISVQITNATGGAGWNDPPNIALPFGYSPTVAIKCGTGTTVDFIRYLLVSEVTEMFMASKNNGWFQSSSLFQGADEGSKGEGLSRFLGFQYKLANGTQNLRFTGFEIVWRWLNSATRPNFVDNNPDDNNPDVTNGCTTCFIYFLHNQLGFSIQAIINAGAATLAGVYTNLTGKTDAWQSFSDLVNTHYPLGVTYNPAGDNIFPVPNLNLLSDAQLPSGANQTLRILALDTQAPAEVTVTLTSDNPALLSVPAQLTFPVGDWSIGVDLQAAVVPGPPQSVNIHASYAGKTLTSNVQVLPRASIIAGQVTDSAFHGIGDATVMIQSDTAISPTIGTSLQLSTDGNGFFETPAVLPHFYTITATQSGYVPSTTGVTVNEGVPVTTVNFALATTKSFTIIGTVTDPKATPIAGATITLNQNSPIPGRIQIKTDANGHYSVSMNPGPYNGTFTISADDAGYVSDSVTITIPNGATITENFVLSPLGVLTGTIADAGKTPVAGATVTVGALSTQSVAGGHYAVAGLNPGVNDVTVRAIGFNGAEISVMITSGATTTQDFILVKASAVITGTVTNANDGSPLSGVSVAAASHSTKTDANGTYTIANVPAGQVQVTASAVRYHAEHAVVQVTDHQTVTVDFQLSSLRQPPGPVVRQAQFETAK